MDDKNWSKTLDLIKANLSPANFRTWFGSASFESQSKDGFTIKVASAFIKQQLLGRYLELIEETAVSVTGQRLRLEIKVDSSINPKVSPSAKEDFEFQMPPSPGSNTNLNFKYTMKSFVVGLSNQLAYAAAQAVIQNPGVSYNPLFIYGGTGVGKTHLMQAIGNALLSKNGGLKIIYCSTEKFTNDFIQSIQTKRTGDFRARYRAADLLLIDDIQFISGRDSTQEEFFHTFNELQSKNSQIILTSDRPPHEMQELEARLRSRFQGGLMVDIQQPDFDTRVAILRAKCQEKGVMVAEDILTQIAEAMPTNARELEGKLIQILQATSLNGESLDIDLAKRYLGQKSAEGIKPDYKKVLSEINGYFNIKMSDLTGPRRKKELVVPRHLAMFLLYENLSLPYEKIGDILGGRDHTTVLHGVEKMRGAMENDHEMQRITTELKQILGL